MIIMMFIGAAQGSSGGGIKVISFAILIGALIAMVRGKKNIVMFERRIASDRIYSDHLQRNNSGEIDITL